MKQPSLGELALAFPLDERSRVQVIYLPYFPHLWKEQVILIQKEKSSLLEDSPYHLVKFEIQ